MHLMESFSRVAQARPFLFRSPHTENDWCYGMKIAWFARLRRQWTQQYTHNVQSAVHQPYCKYVTTNMHSDLAFLWPGILSSTCMAVSYSFRILGCDYYPSSFTTTLHHSLLPSSFTTTLHHSLLPFIIHCYPSPFTTTLHHSLLPFTINYYNFHIVQLKSLLLEHLLVIICCASVSDVPNHSSKRWHSFVWTKGSTINTSLIPRPWYPCTGLIPRPLVLMAWVRGYANMCRSHTQTTCPHGLGTRHVQVSYPDHLSSWPGYEVTGDSSTFSLTTGEAGGSRSWTLFMKSCIEVSFSARKLSRGWS